MKRVVDCLHAEKYGILIEEMMRLFASGQVSKNIVQYFLLQQDELKATKLDVTSQLLSRGMWYELFAKTLLQEFSFLKELDSLDIDTLQSLQDSHASRMAQFILGFGDMAYLGIANFYGHHDQGDALIQGVGQAFIQSWETLSSDDQKRVFIARRGGDEFLFLFEGISESQQNIFWDIANNLVSSIEIANLQKFHLIPRMDIGKASLCEAFSLFLEIKRRGGRAKKSSFDAFMDICVELADIRSNINKKLFRIPFILEKEKELSRREYAEVHSELTKSCVLEDADWNAARFFLKRKEQVDAQDDYYTVTLYDIVRRSMETNLSGEHADVVLHQAFQHFV